MMRLAFSNFVFTTEAAGPAPGSTLRFYAVSGFIVAEDSGLYTCRRKGRLRKLSTLFALPARGGCVKEGRLLLLYHVFIEDAG